MCAVGVCIALCAFVDKSALNWAFRVIVGDAAYRDATQPALEEAVEGVLFDRESKRGRGRPLLRPDLDLRGRPCHLTAQGS